MSFLLIQPLSPFLFFSKDVYPPLREGVSSNHESNIIIDFTVNKKFNILNGTILDFNNFVPSEKELSMIENCYV